MRPAFLFLIAPVLLIFLVNPWAGSMHLPVAALQSELTWRGWMTIGLFLLTFLALVKELMPPDIIMVLSAGVLVMTGTLTPAEFLSGFAQDIVFIIAMLCIVVRTLEVNGVLVVVAKKFFPRYTHTTAALAYLLPPVSVFSAFLNNTPIVLMMTPMIRRWALSHKVSPSRFLIPLSYAAIFGGMCTLIGTSTNLIINGFLQKSYPDLTLSFFELGIVGFPLALLGLLFTILIGHHLIPDRIDITSALVEQAREFTVEMLVEEGSPFAGKTLRETTDLQFQDQHLLEIERGYQKITSPGPEDVIRIGDRLVFVGDINQIANLHKIKGLKSTADPHFQLEPSSSHFSEVVISATSTLVGKTIRRAQFRKMYGASVIAVYRQGKRVEGRVRDIILQPGDTLMLLSPERWQGAEYYRNDFFYIRQDEKIVTFSLWRFVFLLTVLVLMVVAAAMGVSLVLATLGAAMAYIFSKSISIREVRRSISWDLLILIGAAFGFGFGLQVTGVARYFASIVLSISGTNPYALTGAIFLVTVLITEMMTNNAAALIVFPIALEMVQLAGFGTPLAAKAIGVTIAIAASSSFLTPIGYQTNTIVYGPGGYRFTDYFRIGLPLTLIFLLFATFYIPLFWPFA